ncbi:hypothetical protein PM082_024203 [Marasmius tenuissimus]|nr:hypothetical protein PM082_024203 [Marasmius tenuissimus]
MEVHIVGCSGLDLDLRADFPVLVSTVDDHLRLIYAAVNTPINIHIRIFRQHLHSSVSACYLASFTNNPTATNPVCKG